MTQRKAFPIPLPFLISIPNWRMATKGHLISGSSGSDVKSPTPAQWDTTDGSAHDEVTAVGTDVTTSSKQLQWTLNKGQASVLATKQEVVISARGH
ncbi:hypothetical protein EVAR_90220_1 [Eumeta japonica]|uniref:Uncharacterized protein n=1 Tax=Eumeta variegata TaxID=151549 RepID=A0A4C1WUU6_EUMVA|nr:hypothetical protein EVAR_90220_1 [Eumeta japonica]